MDWYDTTQGLQTLNQICDAVIALAYFAIPLELFVFYQKYFSKKAAGSAMRPVVYLFVAFIILCGLTHVSGVGLSFDHGSMNITWVSTTIRIACAVVSIVTAFVMVRIIPAALRFPDQVKAEVSVTIAQEYAEDAVNKAEQRRRLRHIIQSLHDEFDEQTLLNTAADAFQRLLGVDRVNFFVRDGGAGDFRCVAEALAVVSELDEVRSGAAVLSLLERYTGLRGRAEDVQGVAINGRDVIVSSRSSVAPLFTAPVDVEWVMLLRIAVPEASRAIILALQHGTVNQRVYDLQSLAVKQVILDFAQQVELALFRSNLSCQVRTLQGQVNQLVSRIKAKANGTHSAVDGPFHLSHASGELVASLSHEIRTPMTAIVGMTELMLAEVSSSYSAHQRDQLEVIANSANLLMATVDGIFNSQRIDGVIINYAPLNLRQCIESGFEMVAPEARSKGIELAYFTDALIPEDLIGDNTRLSQVIMNLVSNGIKYSHAGHVILQASQVPQPHGMKPLDIDGLSTVYIEISVTDTGNGIPVEFIQTLFSRTDSSRYGLPLCEALIKKMKGKIWLDKTASTGTVFRLIVPLLTSARQNVPSQPLPSPTGTEHRVMLVGTSPLVTRHIAELLQVKGFKYERADAHDRRRAGLFRALIFDLNSFLQAETADALNEWAGELADTPADTILLVENAADIEKHGVDPEQFSAIITKPVRHAALFGLLHIPDATGGIQHHRRSSPSRRASLTKHRQSATQHMSAPSILSTAQPSLVPAGDLLRKCRAIVVDDNGFNMKLITMQLEKIGLGFVKGVTSGQGALDELDVVQQDRNMAQYNIMVLDLNMPGMDGFETARRTLQRFPHSRPAIIACTANSGADAENVKKQCFQTGMDGFLSKPVKMADLQCEIVRVLSEQKPASPSSLKDR